MVLECCCYFVVLKVVFGMYYAGERLSIVGSIYVGLNGSRVALVLGILKVIFGRYYADKRSGVVEYFALGLNESWVLLVLRV